MSSINKTVSAMEARRRFGEIMNRVALRGEQFTVERAGKPLVQIVPFGGSSFNPNDPFDNPFVTFTEWNDPSNDVYDQLSRKKSALSTRKRETRWTKKSRNYSLSASPAKGSQSDRILRDTIPAYAGNSYGAG